MYHLRFFACVAALKPTDIRVALYSRIFQPTLAVSDVLALFPRDVEKLVQPRQYRLFLHYLTRHRVDPLYRLRAAAVKV